MSVASQTGRIHRHRVHRVLLESSVDNQQLIGMTRARPNILITGTPGTGKTTHAEMVGSATGFRHINIGDIVKAHQLHCGFDEEFDSYLLDEDKVRHTAARHDVCVTVPCDCSYRASI